MAIKILAAQHPSNMYGNETFHQILGHKDVLFQKTKFKSLYDFVKKFASYLDKTKFPCNTIVIYVFNGYNNIVELSLRYDNNRISNIKVLVRQQIIKIDSVSFESDGFKIFKPIIQKFFDDLLLDAFNNALSVCGITSIHSEVNLPLIYEKNFEEHSRIEFTSINLDEAFDRYITANDQLKYINGSEYRFINSNWRSLFSLWSEMKKENVFLANAVRRGVTID